MGEFAHPFLRLLDHLAVAQFCRLLGSSDPSVAIGAHDVRGLGDARGAGRVAADHICISLTSSALRASRISSNSSLRWSFGIAFHAVVS